MVACLHYDRDNLSMINGQHEHMSFKATWLGMMWLIFLILTVIITNCLFPFIGYFRPKVHCFLNKSGKRYINNPL